MCQPYQYNVKLTENGILYVPSCQIRKQTANIKFQKQLPRGVPRKRCSENMQQIYRRTPMPKCSFNKIAKQLF